MDTGLLGSRERGKAEKAETRESFARHSKVVFPEVGVKVPLHAALTRAAFSL
jgi:hypothetical protein